jgi:hypothetical protein
MSSSPYASLPAESFWRPAVAEQPPGPLAGLYRSHFEITPETRIAVVGDCFAQAFAEMLHSTTAAVMNCEPAPPGLSDELAARFGYRPFSARHGNVYFARQLRQLIDEAYGRHMPADPVWERGGRYFDALRPAVEPEGLCSPEEVVAHRKDHLAAVRELLESVDVLVWAFSLGEAWLHRESGTVYPVAPSIVAGAHDPSLHAWRAFGYAETCEDFRAAARALRELNPQLRLLTMVSPVPATATVSGEHVLAANTRHKSMLRAAAGTLADELESVDYFPAFELVATHFSRGALYEANRRTVSPEGLAVVLDTFLEPHPELERAPVEKAAPLPEADPLCDESLLEGLASAS